MEKDIKVGDIVWIVGKSINNSKFHIFPGKIYRIEQHYSRVDDKEYPEYYYGTEYDAHYSSFGDNLYLSLKDLKQSLLKSLDNAIEEAEKLDIHSKDFWEFLHER